MTLEATASFDHSIQYSLPRLDRPVVNQTGIAGLFDFHLKFAPDETMPDFRDSGADATASTPPEPAGPSIFSALQRQLGLKLEAAKGLGDFFVIDQVQKPPAN